MELYQRIKKVIQTFHEGKASRLAAKIGVPANTFSRQIAENFQKKISLHLLFQILENSPQVNRNWLLFGEGEMTGGDTAQPARTAPAAPNPSEVRAQDLSDPIAQRVAATRQALEAIGSAPETIESAILAIVRPQVTYDRGQSFRERGWTAAEEADEYGNQQGNKQAG